jgi:hypothetical protein
MHLVYSTVLYLGAGIILVNLEVIAAGKGWGDEEIAGQEDRKRYYQPFGADEYD